MGQTIYIAKPLGPDGAKNSGEVNSPKKDEEMEIEDNEEPTQKKLKFNDIIVIDS